MHPVCRSMVYRWLSAGAAGRPGVNEVSARHVGGLLRRRRTPEDGVAVRKPAEPGNDIEMLAGAIEVSPMDRHEMHGDVAGEALPERDDTTNPLQVSGPFGVDQRQQEEELLPELADGIEVAVAQPILGH